MKKRILTLALVVATLATCFGGTLAYLQDSKSQKNTFTTGNVYINLDEADVDGEGRTSENQTYHLFPGAVITKDPTITVKAESESAWVAAKVTVTGNLYGVAGIAGTNMIDINTVAKGGLLAKAPAVVQNWNGLALVHETADCVVYQDANKAGKTWTLYVFMKAVQPKNATIALFERIEIPATWGNTEMTAVNGMEISVQAFAAQTYGFDTCYQAMTTAFATEFAAVKK